MTEETIRKLRHQLDDIEREKTKDVRKLLADIESDRLRREIRRFGREPVA